MKILSFTVSSDASLITWWFFPHLIEAHQFPYVVYSGVGAAEGLLYAVGGHDGPLVRKSVEVYNPELNIWTQVADMHYCRRNAG